MKKHLFWALVLVLSQFASAQNYPTNLLSVNAFRNPSIGVEFQRKQLSLHVGYYPTNFESGVTTEFFKTGLTYWFLATDNKEISSSFYSGLSYLRGTSRDYKDVNAVGVEAGYRWYIWKGLNLRLGVIALAAEGKDVQINPTPSIGYSLKF